MLQSLKMIGILTAQTEFILGKTKKFSKREVPLSEILEITEAILGENLKKGRMKLVFPKTKLLVKADRDVVMSGLEHIVKRLMPHTHSVQMKVDEKKKNLSLHYKSDVTVLSNKLPLIETLRKSNDPAEIFFEIYVAMMKKSGVRTKFSEGVIELNF